MLFRFYPNRGIHVFGTDARGGLARVEGTRSISIYLNVSKVEGYQDVGLQRFIAYFVPFPVALRYMFYGRRRAPPARLSWRRHYPFPRV